MLCNRCNKSGAKTYKYNNGGVITDVFLCDDCFSFLSRQSQRNDVDSQLKTGERSNTDKKSESVARATGGRGENLTRASEAGKKVATAPSILSAGNKCPTCGTSFAEIKRTGYIGCVDCFKFFKNRLIPVIDKFQSNVISNPQKKQREMRVMMLEAEYSELSASSISSGNTASIAARMREIEKELYSLGVKTDA